MTEMILKNGKLVAASAEFIAQRDIDEAGEAARAIAAFRSQVDLDAENERLRYITGGAGQAIIYAQKAEEARQYLLAPDLPASNYPMLNAEVGITAPTLEGVARIVSEAHIRWVLLGARIEAVRLAAKRAITAAQNVQEARAAYEEIQWPSGL